MNYCYSSNEERYHDDLDEVVSEYLDMMDPTHIEVGTVLHLWRGEIVKITPQMLVPYPSDLVGEHMGEVLYEHAGEVADNWPAWDHPTCESFNRSFWDWLETWMVSHNEMPTTWSVQNVKPFNLRITAVRDAETGDVDWEEVTT
jgi:hypothetical protein